MKKKKLLKFLVGGVKKTVWFDMNKLLILDGRHMLWRAISVFSTLYCEIDGEEIGTGGVYGFLSNACRVWRKNKCKVVVAWEGVNNFRNKIYPDYKRREESEHRDLLLCDLAEQEQRLRAILRALGVEQYTAIGCEADDVMATLAVNFVENYDDSEAFIYTGDSDLLQVVTDKITVIAPIKRKDMFMTPNKVFEKYKLPPSKISDLKALSGDSSDNIPGIKGVGNMTAKKLLDAFDDVDGVIKAAMEDVYWPVSESLRFEIRKNFKELKLFKDLTTIKLDAEYKSIKTKRNKKRVLDYFGIYSFSSLMQPLELNALMGMGK